MIIDNCVEKFKLLIMRRPDVSCSVKHCFYQHTMISAGHGLPRKNEGCPMPNCLCLDWFQMELQANQNVQTASGDRVAQIKLASNYMYMYGGLTKQYPKKNDQIRNERSRVHVSHPNTMTDLSKCVLFCILRIIFESKS